METPMKSPNTSCELLDEYVNALVYLWDKNIRAIGKKTHTLYATKKETLDLLWAQRECIIKTAIRFKTEQ